MHSLFISILVILLVVIIISGNGILRFADKVKA